MATSVKIITFEEFKIKFPEFVVLSPNPRTGRRAIMHKGFTDPIGYTAQDFNPKKEIIALETENGSWALSNRRGTDDAFTAMLHKA